MGLAASQARLLNLTRRMHDIEYKAQNLEAQKLQMANESKAVYAEYENALNRQKVQFKQINPDGAASYEDANLTTLLNAGYGIKILNDNVWYDFTGADTNGVYTNKAGSWIAYKDNVESLTYTVPKDMNAGDYFTTGNPSTTYKLAEPAKKDDTSVKVYKPAATQDDTAKGELAKIDLTSEVVLRNLVEAGFIVFEKPMGDGTFEEVNIATDTNLQEVSDDVELKKAEAKYEADMRKINQKDKKFDTDLAAMDAERNAVKTEIETLKSIAKDNVDRTFKLFS